MIRFGVANSPFPWGYFPVQVWLSLRYLHEVKPFSLFNATQILGISNWETQVEKSAVVFIVFIVLIGTRCLNESNVLFFVYCVANFALWKRNRLNIAAILHRHFNADLSCYPKFFNYAGWIYCFFNSIMWLIKMAAVNFVGC